jgi:hypothetical protein
MNPRVLNNSLSCSTGHQPRALQRGYLHQLGYCVTKYEYQGQPHICADPQGGQISLAQPDLRRSATSYRFPLQFPIVRVGVVASQASGPAQHAHLSLVSLRASHLVAGRSQHTETDPPRLT